MLIQSSMNEKKNNRKFNKRNIVRPIFLFSFHFFLSTSLKPRIKNFFSNSCNEAKFWICFLIAHERNLHITHIPRKSISRLFSISCNKERLRETREKKVKKEKEKNCCMYAYVHFFVCWDVVTDAQLEKFVANKYNTYMRIELILKEAFFFFSTYCSLLQTNVRSILFSYYYFVLFVILTL